MIDPKAVTAVVVTDGRCDLDPVLQSMDHFGAILIWENRSCNRKVYGRYLALEHATTEYVYVQDDDCIVDSKALCAQYRAPELLCNVLPSHQPYYPRSGGITLVGWGAIFHRSVVQFAGYLAQYPEDDLFDRECDRIFTWLNRAITRVVYTGVTHLPHALGIDRMGMEARHGADLQEVKARLAAMWVGAGTR